MGADIRFSSARRIATRLSTLRHRRVQTVSSSRTRTLQASLTFTVVAAAVFGAAIRTAKQGYSVKGGKDFNGTALRSDEQLTALNQFGDSGVLRDYCNFGDYVCAKGSEPSALENHLNYFKKYNTEAAKWLIKTAFTTAGDNDALANFEAAVSPSASASSAHATATKKAAAKASETSSAVAASSPSSGAVASRSGVFSGVLGLSVFAYLL